MSGKKRGGYVGASCVCAHCGGDAKFVAHRGKGLLSLVGRLYFMRSYYHCRTCGEGHCPWEKTLRLTHPSLTPGAEEVVSMLGVQNSFAEAAERTLKKACGLNVSESTVERTTEAAGERLIEQQQQRVKLGDNQPWEWERDAQGRTCACVSLDATGVRQQGENGAAADGRMAYVAMISNPRGAAQTRERYKAYPPHQVRYLAGFYELDQLSIEFRGQAGQVGWDQADVKLAYSDGGSGLEEFFRKNFPGVIVILDIWHAKEHLVELSKAVFGDESVEGKDWLDARCHQLKHEGGTAVRTTLETMDVSDRSEAVREAHRLQTNYFRNHEHKMNYPEYLSHGWAIGSGPVESACKTVVNQRLNGSGMRWGSDGSNALCHLRALFLSERNQWDYFWQLA